MQGLQEIVQGVFRLQAVVGDPTYPVGTELHSLSLYQSAS